VHTNFALIVDRKGRLWHLGANSSRKGGFKDPLLTSHELREQTWFSENGLIVRDVAVGTEHALVVAYKKDDRLQRDILLTMGQDSTNHYHLGVSEEEAANETICIREVNAFYKHKISCISAGGKTSYVILQGHESPVSNIYDHELPD